jgi:hypothetical protein
VLVLGDFSGSSQTAPTFRSLRVAIDDFDAVIGAVAPKVPIAAPDHGNPTSALAISALEQLHPDYLATTVPHLRELLELDLRLRDPRTEQQALAELDTLTGRPEKAATPATAAAGGDKRDESSDQLLGRLLGNARREDHGNQAAQARVRQLIDDALGSVASQASSSSAVEGRARVAELLNARCRRILVEPQFRSVERAWRSVHWLASRLEDDEAHLYLVDL